MKQPKFSASATSQGYTLIEILVVVIMLGVLAAIAAPSWVAFLNNQRVGTARSQVAEMLRKGQDEAKRTKTNRAVVLDNNNNQPRMAIVPLDPATGAPIALAQVIDWTVLGTGDIKSGAIQLNTQQQGSTVSSLPASVVFDGEGTVVKNGTVKTLPFAVTVQPVSSQEPRRCIIMQTLLGAMREGASSDCQNL